MDGEETLAGDDTAKGSDPSATRSAPVLPKSSASGFGARGDTVQRYVILDRVGSGSMGVVYAAYDPELDRKVAIKLLHPRRVASGTRGDEYRRGLLREAQAIARVSHPNVVAIHDVGEHDGRVFLAMEFITGTTLRAWLSPAPARTPRSIAEIVDVFVAAGRGLAAAHAKGLVHRDFKPDNVMLDDEGRARVLDFGLVRTSGDPMVSPAALQDHDVIQPSTDALGSDSRDDVIAGTPQYMSPEQLRGVGVDARSDQFSFCVALFEAMYGIRPFAGTSTGSRSVALGDHRVAEPPAGAKVPGALRRIVLRGLAPDPGDRWPDMLALIDALGRVPARRRRRGMVESAVLGAAALGVGVAWFIAAAPHRRCAHEVASADPWSAEQRDALEAALVRSGTAFEQQTWERVAARLDQRALAWRDRSLAACVDAVGDPLASARHLCLARQRRELITTIDALATADDGVLGAVAAVMKLPDAARCADDIELGREVEPPPPEIEADVLAVTDELTRARAQAALGRFDDAAALAAAALASARDLAYPPLVARAAYVLGTIDLASPDFDPGQARLREAFDLFVEIGDDRGAADAAQHLATAIGGHQAHPDQGQVWLDVSRAMRRTDGASVGDDVAALVVSARIHGSRGQLLEARADLERALALGEGAGLDDDSVVLNNLGAVLRSIGDLDAAEATFARQLELETELRGSLHPDTINARASMANVAYARRDLQGAIDRYRAALVDLEPIVGADDRRVTAIIFNLANCYTTRGEFETALPLYRRALASTIADVGADHPDAIFTMGNIAAVYFMSGDSEEALVRYGEVTLAIERRLGADHPDLAQALANLASVELSLGRNEDAMSHLRRGIAITEKILGPNDIKLAASFVALGEAYLNLEQPREALLNHERALAIYEATLGPAHADLSGALLGIGQSRVALGDHPRAIAAFERALAIREQADLTPDERADARFRLGRALVRRPRRVAAERERGLALIRAAEAEATADSDIRDTIAKWRRENPSP